MSSPPTDYPLEYLHGSVEFFGKKYRITPDVLIPRLETEWLVRRARNLLRNKKYTRVVDIGSGSGIIGISVADLAEEVIFLDISEAALEIARENYHAHFWEKKSHFIVSDLLSNLPSRAGEHTLFLTNLPYIKANDWEHMSPDTRYEPEIALFGGQLTGFELYDRLFRELSIRGEPGDLLIEFGYDQREVAESSLWEYGWRYEFFADYSGVERFCEIHL